MSGSFESAEKAVAALVAEHSAGGVGVAGVSVEGRGVEGRSRKGVGVVGVSDTYRAIEGRSNTEHAILGQSTKGCGVAGISEDNRGVQGRSTNEHGVFGESTKGAGVAGYSASSSGVVGRSSDGMGVQGQSDSGTGVTGASTTGVGVQAESSSTATAALAAHQMNPDSKAAAIYAKHTGRGLAANLDGDVQVSGTLIADGDIILRNADCAEDFDIDDGCAIQPGTVVVLGEHGTLHRSEQAYDRCVAGVVSGAGEYRPGIVLDKKPNRRGDRLPVALLGKTFCWVDADHSPIVVGDLLTTSPTPGHAMKAADPGRAFGAVLGKALQPLAEGQGLVPVLVALQ